MNLTGLSNALSQVAFAVQQMRDRLPATLLNFGGRDAVNVTALQTVTVLAATVTRPADTVAYGAGDMIWTATTGTGQMITVANAVKEAGNAIRIERVRVHKSQGSVTPTIRVHFFEVAQGLTGIQDNVAFVTGAQINTGLGAYVGSVSVPLTSTALGGGAFGAAAPSTPMTIQPSSGTSIFMVLEAQTAFTPGSAEVFTIELEGYRA